MRARQARVESGLKARGYKTRARTENVANALIVEGPDDNSDAQSLIAQMPEVKSVHKVRIFKKTLDRAAQVHGVVAAWEQLGIGKAGAGIKIGILDSGIELTHAGFQDESLPAIEGYPKVSPELNLAFTNRKVVVARSYSNLFSRNETDTTALDLSGHGTAVAMSAAGVRHESPMGLMSGMAPAAYLGVYKIFGTPGINDGTTDAAILKAIDDAVADGMDVINLSFGTQLAARPENDIIVKALAQAEAAGVIAVVSAGNDGPGLATLGSPASAPTALTIGANENGKVTASALVSNGETLALAKVGSNTATTGRVSGALVSVKTLDPAETACAELPADSLTARIALVQRGVCTFEVKINNVGRAGALAAVIYSDEARASDFLTMAAATATLPAVFITYADGLKLKQQLDNSSGIDSTLDLALKARDADAFRLADFSSAGPISGVPVKPDALAVGTNVYTAAQTNNINGDVYSSDGYTSIAGTSFSSPIAAGLVAVLKSARPGMLPVEYRSMLVNSARPLSGRPNLTLTQTGAGLLDLSRALAAPLRFSPVSVSFTSDQQTVEVKNLSSTAASYRISVEPKQGAAPAVSTTQLDLEAGATAQLQLRFARAEMDAGAYTGAVFVEAEGGPAMRVPYWFGKANDAAPIELQVLEAATSARSGTVQRNLFFFRVLDANGIAIERLPQVKLVSGTGTLQEVKSRDFDLAGSFGIEIVLGLGANVIEVDAGNGLVRQFSFQGR